MTEPVAQQVSATAGFAYGVIGADIHVFANGVPLYLLERHQAAASPDPGWLRELPSRMLNARHAVVGFTGAGARVGRLRDWRDESHRLSVRWLHGPGGQGKFAEDALALALQHLGRLYGDEREWARALPALREARDIYRLLADDGPEAYAARLAEAAQGLGAVLAEMRRYAEAVAPMLQACAAYEHLVDAGDESFADPLAEMVTSLVMILESLRRWTESLGPTAFNVTLQIRLTRADPDRVPHLALALWKFAAVRLAAGVELNEAVQAAEQAVSFYAELAKTTPSYVARYQVAAERTRADLRQRRRRRARGSHG